MENKQKYLTNKEAALYLGLGPHILNRWRVTGKGPRYIKFERSVLYAVDELEAFVKSKTRVSTSQDL